MIQITSFTDEMVLNGGANIGEGETLELSGTGGVGSAWYKTLLLVEAGFRTTFRFKCAVSGDSECGGLAFVIQNSEEDTDAIGGDGSGLGYSGISKSVVIELDPYGPTNDDGTAVEDASGGHLSVHTRGVDANSAEGSAALTGSVYANADVISSLFDGEEHALEVRYENGLLEVFVDELEGPVISVQFDLTTIGLTNGQAYVGFTASDGGTGAGRTVSEWEFERFLSARDVTIPLPEQGTVKGGTMPLETCLRLSEDVSRENVNVTFDLSITGESEEYTPSLSPESLNVVGAGDYEFQITTKSVYQRMPFSIQASGGGVTAEETLTVLPPSISSFKFVSPGRTGVSKAAGDTDLSDGDVDLLAVVELDVPSPESGIALGLQTTAKTSSGQDVPDDAVDLALQFFVEGVKTGSSSGDGTSFTFTGMSTTQELQVRLAAVDTEYVLSVTVTACSQTDDVSSATTTFTLVPPIEALTVPTPALGGRSVTGTLHFAAEAQGQRLALQVDAKKVENGGQVSAAGWVSLSDSQNADWTVAADGTSMTRDYLCDATSLEFALQTHWKDATVLSAQVFDITVTCGAESRAASLTLVLPIAKVELSDSTVMGTLGTSATVTFKPDAAGQTLSMGVVAWRILPDGSLEEAGEWVQPQTLSVTVPADLVSKLDIVTYWPQNTEIARELVIRVTCLDQCVDVPLELLPPLKSLKPDPTAVMDGASVSGTLEISEEAPAEGMTVKLGGDLLEFGVLTCDGKTQTSDGVPIEITLKSTSTISFSVAATAPGGWITTKDGDVTEPVTIEARAGEQVMSTTLAVIPALASVTLEGAPTWSVTGGDTVTGEVALSQAAPADFPQVIVEASPEGVVKFVDNGNEVSSLEWSPERYDTSLALTISTTPVSVATSVTIVAQFPGPPGSTDYREVRQATLVVKPPSLPANGLVLQSPVLGGTRVHGTLTLDGAAPAGGWKVIITGTVTSPEDAAMAAKLPLEVPVEEDELSASFGVETSPVAVSQTIAVVATSVGGDDTTEPVNLEILPPSLPTNGLVQLPQVLGGTRVHGTLTLSGPAPTGGLEVTLESSPSNPSLAVVPSSVIIPEGLKSAAFSIATFPTEVDDVVTITAYSSADIDNKLTTDLSITAFALLPVSLEQAGNVVTGGNRVEGRVTLTGPAPREGVTVSIEVRVDGALQAQRDVVVPGYQKSVTFPLELAATSEERAAEITATYEGEEETFELRIVPPSFGELQPSYLPCGASSQSVRLCLTGPAPEGGLDLSVAGTSGPISVTPGEIKIGAGEREAKLDVVTSVVDIDQVANVSFIINGETINAKLTVLSARPRAVWPSPALVSYGTADSSSEFDVWVELDAPAPEGGLTVTLKSLSERVTFANGSATTELAMASRSTLASAKALARAPLAGGAREEVTLTADASVLAQPLECKVSLISQRLASISLSPLRFTSGAPWRTWLEVSLSGSAPKEGLEVQLSTEDGFEVEPTRMWVPPGVPRGGGALEVKVTGEVAAGDTWIAVHASVAGTTLTQHVLVTGTTE